ncbi:MAG: hypothetical protein GXP55_24445 [Deltaproteobacteria bacterium]|nr:hypothetical protein [Deltaproteobacteria bacterium]
MSGEGSTSRLDCIPTSDARPRLVRCGGRERLRGDLAFDGRHLFATYIDDTGHSVLDVLEPGDLSSVERYDLGAVDMTRVVLSPTGSEGAVVYTSPAGTYMRPFSL